MIDRTVQIQLTRQSLAVLDDGKPVREFLVSTSRYGPGERFGSQCTPRGTHIVRAKIGAGLPPDAVFIRRRFTGEIYDSDLARRHPDRDWILTRLMWLSGREPGRNRYGAVDSLRRFIYIHGMPDVQPVGVPFSHGCIRMRNTDVIELYEMIDTGTIVDITA
jgi:lipoprotein-anchoring transpeptidase ErfK/SrfK